MSFESNQPKFGLFFDEESKKWFAIALNDEADETFGNTLGKSGAKQFYQEIQRRNFSPEMKVKFPNAISALRCENGDAALVFVPNACTFSEVREGGNLRDDHNTRG